MHEQLRSIESKILTAAGLTHPDLPLDQRVVALAEATRGILAELDTLLEERDRRERKRDA